MKPPLIFLSLLAGLTLAGCDGHNQIKVRQCIIDDSKSSEVMPIPGEKWKFIVRKTDGTIWYYESMAETDPKPTDKVQLFASPAPR